MGDNNILTGYGDATPTGSVGFVGAICRPWTNGRGGDILVRRRSRRDRMTYCRRDAVNTTDRERRDAPDWTRNAGAAGERRIALSRKMRVSAAKTWAVCAGSVGVGGRNNNTADGPDETDVPKCSSPASSASAAP